MTALTPIMAVVLVGFMVIGAALPALPTDKVAAPTHPAKTLQKFSSIHAQVHNHFNQERHLVTREVYKQRRSAALVEWRGLAA